MTSPNPHAMITMVLPLTTMFPCSSSKPLASTGFWKFTCILCKQFSKKNPCSMSSLVGRCRLVRTFCLSSIFWKALSTHVRLVLTSLISKTRSAWVFNRASISSLTRWISSSTFLISKWLDFTSAFSSSFTCCWLLCSANTVLISFWDVSMSRFSSFCPASIASWLALTSASNAARHSIPIPPGSQNFSRATASKQSGPLVSQQQISQMARELAHSPQHGPTLAHSLLQWRY